MGDIAYWDDDFAEKLGEVRALVAKLKDREGLDKANAIDTCERKLSSLEGATRRSFNMELRMIANADTKQVYQRKLDGYNRQVEELRGELRWARKEVDGAGAGARAALFGDRGGQAGAAAPAQAEVTRVDILDATDKIQDKTEASLGRTLKSIQEANDTGDAILQSMAEQTETLKKIDEDLTNIQSELDKAKEIMTSFIKRVKTDKLLMVFALLILLGILGLIIFLAVNKNSSN